MMTFVALAVVVAFMFLFCGTAHAGTDYTDEIIGLFQEFFEENEWHFKFDEDNNTFTFNLNIDGKLQHLRYFVPVRSNGFTVYAISPLNADSKDSSVMSRMADFVCRANYGLRNGNFELDMRDGEIRYKIHVDCDECLASSEVVRNSIMIPSVMFERYSVGMLDIMFKDTSAEDAIAKCE
ncbi:MAG: hypothetical protein IJU31_01965 [Synergistaceae bacterium]|nr:hypothetical protein [Synergistaceae bacterium]